MSGSTEIAGVEIQFETVRRFFEKIEVREKSECIWWTGYKDRKGYGQFGSSLTKSGITKAHRFSFWIHRGPIFDDEEVDHLCRNPACVNPYHMELVSKSENTARGNRNRTRR